MKAPALPDDEPRRIEALRAYGILDSPAEPRFDAIATLAATLLEVPIALVCFVDTDRQWFKARHGLATPETPREVSFCGHVIVDRAPLVVHDTLLDPRFADNPLVVGDPRIRFYAGAPVETADGLLLGTVCAIDHRPRTPTPPQLEGLQQLARIVLDLLETRRTALRLKEVAEARRAADERFRIVVEASPNAKLIVDGARVITLVNRSAEQLFGYRRDELLGRPIEVLVPDQFRASHPDHVTGFHAAAMARAMGAGRELFGRRKDGSDVPVEIGLSPIHTQEGIATLASIVDVTERKRAERAERDAIHRLEQLTERFQLAATAARIGVWDWDVVNNVLVWDASMHQLYGTRPMAFGSEYDTWQAAVHPDDRAGAAAAITAALSGVAEFSPTFRIVRPGGEVRHVRAAALVQRDPRDGQATRMIGVNIDVTEHKVAELELRRSNAELEQFAYVASHDLQEPLRMVASYTELLAQRYRGQLDDKADQYIFYAVDGAKRMQRLIADMLAYSRVGSQGKPLEPVAAGAVVDDVRELLAHAIEAAGATLEVTALPTVLADEGQLLQLFQNLIGNALKFRGDATPRVAITATPDGDRWRFAVADNGIGLDMKYADRIFQMFQRLHERGRYDGSGIGLAIVKRIVERHGGRIWLTSTPGAGTTVYFTLQAATLGGPR